MINLIKKILFHFEKKFAKRFLRKAIGKTTYRKDIIGYIYDNISLDILFEGDYEKEYQVKSFEFIRKHLEKLDVLIDVGGNIGTTVFHAYPYFEKIYSIEAFFKTFQILKLNTMELKNVEIINETISNTIKNTELIAGENYMCGASISEDSKKIIDNKKSFSANVTTTTLDILFKDLKPKSLVIKFDIEDEEYNAVIGADELIKKYKPILIIEINRRQIQNGSSKLFRHLTNINYEMFNVQPLDLGNNPNPKKIKFIKNKKSEMEIIKINKLYRIYDLYRSVICIPRGIQ